MSLGFVLFASSLLAGGCGAGSRHDGPFRAVAADNGRMAVAGRLSAIEKAGMAGPLPIPFCRQAVREIRFIACVGTAPWLALGSPSIPGILSAWTTDAIRQGQEKCAQSRRPS